jgi:hypothetical protein
MSALTRPQKITYAEMREAGVPGVLIYCSDYHSHSIAISGDPKRPWCAAALGLWSPTSWPVRLTAISPRETMFVDVGLCQSIFRNPCRFWT